MTDTEENPCGRESPRDPIAGFLSGLLLMIAGVFPVLSPVQLIAFVPLLLVLRRTSSWRQRLRIGLLMGLGFVTPHVFLLRLPAPVAVVLVVYFLALIMAFVCVCSFLVRGIGIWSSFAFGALLVVLDRRHRVASLVCLIVMAALVGGADVAVLAGRPTGCLKVAAVGWEYLGTSDAANPGRHDGFRTLCEEPLVEATRRGVRPIVFPETAFAVSDDSDSTVLARFVDLCREHRVYVAVGYFNGRSNENRVAFMGPEGVLGRYAKTHLTPFEDYSKGTGEPVMVTIDGIRVGAMICQDDNFTDLSRRYAARHADVLVIPTNDWGPIRKAHLQNTIHRAIESRFAIVRAASNGISAIISPEGKRLATYDHWRHGPGMIVADVPVYPVSGQTLYSRFGNWFVAACGFSLLAYGGSCCLASRGGCRSTEAVG